MPFDVGAFSGITEPTEVIVYSRPVPGTGDFAALPTPSDASANEIVATTDSFSEFALVSNTNPLPVELTAFTATPTSGAGSGEQVTLTWTTVSETKTAGFDVERSAGGEAFTRVGSQPGRGTTMETQRYRFVDRDLPIAEEVTYRLRQIDMDGTETVSEEVTERLLPARVALLPSAPNPFAEVARLHYRLP